jgi:hypothetical protein
MQQWEYRRLCYGWDDERRDLIWEDTKEGDVDGDTLDKRLNRLGREGWELVSVEKISDVSHVVVNFYFKRPIQSSTENQLQSPQMQQVEH